MQNVYFHNGTESHNQTNVGGKTTSVCALIPLCCPPCTKLNFCSVPVHLNNFSCSVYLTQIEHLTTILGAVSVSLCVHCPLIFCQGNLSTVILCPSFIINLAQLVSLSVELPAQLVLIFLKYRICLDQSYQVMTLLVIKLINVNMFIFF